MARRIFSVPPSTFGFATSATLWTARTAGTQVTDLLNVLGAAVTTLSHGQDGGCTFSGPVDGTGALWLQRYDLGADTRRVRVTAEDWPSSDLGGTYVPQKTGYPTQVGPFSRLMTLLAEAEQSCSLNILTDSTGATPGKTRWPAIDAARLAALYAATFATQTVTYNDSLSKYDAPVVLSGNPSARSLTLAANTGLQHPGNGEAITGDIEILWRVTYPAWPVAANGTIISRSSSGAYAWIFGTTTAGKLSFQWTTDGTTSPGQKLSSVIAPAPGTYVKVMLAVATGLVSFHTSPDAITWTAAGTVAGSATSLFDPGTSQQYQLGMAFSGTFGTYTYFEGEVRNGIGGNTVVPRYADAWSETNNVISNGTAAGLPVLTIVIGAVPGLTIDSLADVTRLPKMANVGWGVAGWILSCSHNDVAQRGPLYLAKWDTLLARVLARTPDAQDVAIVLQNPRTAPATGLVPHRARRGELMSWARRNRVGVIDAYRAFMTSGQALSVLVDPTDGIHPTDAAGSPLYADAVMNALLGKSPH